MQQQAFKDRFVRAVLWVGGVGGVASSLMDYQAGYPLMAAGDATGALIIAWLLLFRRGPEHAALHRNALVVMGWAATVIGSFTQIESLAYTITIPSIPILLYFLQSERLGFLWSVAVLVPAVFACVFPGLTFNRGAPPVVQFVPMVFAYSFNMGLAHFYERTRRRLEEQIVQAAVRDFLTGAHNRRSFAEALSSELARCQRYGTPLSVVMLDIDHFKSVNDRFGHHVGDEVLAAVAKILQTRIRKSDFLARYGGEEFIILAMQTELAGAAALAEKLRLALQEVSVQPVGQLTASFGVTSYLGPKDREDELLRRADAALYRAKSSGRNRVELQAEPLPAP